MSSTSVSFFGPIVNWFTLYMICPYSDDDGVDIILVYAQLLGSDSVRFIAQPRGKAGTISYYFFTARVNNGAYRPITFRFLRGTGFGSRLHSSALTPQRCYCKLLTDVLESTVRRAEHLCSVGVKGE